MTTKGSMDSLNSGSKVLSRALEKAQALALRRIRLSRRIESVEARLGWHQTARLVIAGVFVFFLAVASIRSRAWVGVSALVVFIPIFTIFVIRTNRIRDYVQKLKRLEDFFHRQENRALGRPSGRGDGNLKDSSRILETANSDLGIFGSHSLWTLIDETLTHRGAEKLASWLTAKPAAVSEIETRQKRIQSLRKESWFFTKLTLINDADEFRFSANQVSQFLATPFVPKWFTKVFFLCLIAWAFFAASMIYDAVHRTDSTGPFFVVFIVLNYLLSGNSTASFKKGTGLVHYLSLLTPVFESVENRARSSSEIRSICPATYQAGPSREGRSLARIMGFLGVNTNPLLGLLLNVFLPWSVTATYFLERKRAKIVDQFPICIEELAHLEALGSLVIFDHYQTQNYPVFTAGVFSCREIFHPLLERGNAIANDFTFASPKSLGLLTGSNMSGKSTFLRTIGVNQLLANLGAPVFADQFTTAPMQIETCIEVSDSLRDGFSYFYAEVRKLNHLIREAQTQPSVLFLIDEIFRGTNNRERQIGSRAVIRNLAACTNARGFISTHDLELTALADSTPNLINLHFRDEIHDSKMVFSYRLHEGPSPTTNALKIMEMEGISILPADRAGDHS